MFVVSSIITCTVYVPFACRYHIFEVGDPYTTYKINVTVQQLDYNQRAYDKSATTEEVWKTVGFAEIGPQNIGDNTARGDKLLDATSSGPQVLLFSKPIVSGC